VLSVAGDARAHMLQAVYETYDIVPGPLWGADCGGAGARQTRLVVIGRRLDAAALQAQLERCAAAVVV
jgi:G3E family GTPase